MKKSLVYCTLTVFLLNSACALIPTATDNVQTTSSESKLNPSPSTISTTNTNSTQNQTESPVSVSTSIPSSLPTITPTSNPTTSPSDIPLPTTTRSGIILVEGGTFTMGGVFDPADGKYKIPLEEKPAHKVVLDSFYITKTEITQRDYQSLMGKNPSSFKGDNLPVEQVSWWDAIKYCNALSKKEGLPVAYNEEYGYMLTEEGKYTKDITQVKGYRLPTEAEWEFAAKGGNLSKGYKYSGSNDANEISWNLSNSDNKTYFVANKTPNELNLSDMTGNVWEWCSDTYSDYTSADADNPYIYDVTFADVNVPRIRRGGSWGNNIKNDYLHISARYQDKPDFTHSGIGFRVALTKEMNQELGKMLVKKKPTKVLF